MPPRQEHIAIKRVSAKERRAQSIQQDPQDAPEQQPVPSNDADIVRRYKIVAILLVVLGVMVTIAMISHTAHDADNAQLSMRDIMGVVRGDEELRVRFDTTHNWLGLLGAVISQWMIYQTIGRWALIFPALLILWAVDVFRVQRILPRHLRLSVVWMAVAVLLASLIGTLQNVSWLPVIDVSWSGAIGQFIAAITTQLIGVPGSLIVLLTAMAFTVVLGFRLNVNAIMVGSSLRVAKLRDWYEGWRPKQNTSDAVPPAVEPETELPSEEPLIEAQNQDQEQDDIAQQLAVRTSSQEEPAEMLRQPFQPQSLSPSVKILRHVPKSASAPTETPASTERPAEAQPSRSIDLDVVKERLAALHPTRTIDVRPPAEVVPAAVPEPPQPPPEIYTAPLLVDEQDDVVEPTLTVLVEEQEPEETVDTVGGTILYDEQIVYKAPTIDLLHDSGDDADVDDGELRNNARILQEKLETFKIKIENLTVQPGPVVTQYEFVPAAGIKVSQIESLADDIALALKAQGVRIIAPIPGRGTVGIEIPNHHPSVVRFSAIIKSPKYHNPDIRLPIAMGKTVVGDVYCADLAKMPHLLIAGATGKGKSVGINTIIASLLYKMHPRDLKFVIVDPKRVEMTLYRALKDHFLAVSPDINETIVTEPANAVMVLKSVVEEMQQRYTILAAAGQRNIADYNKKAAEGALSNKGGLVHRPMPYIVVIIDELADLMMTASKEVEEPIVRLAQLARAVGIHCVVATQRPSVDVVTGLIKANFPARIAYQVASRIDSRTILDANGAEHLIGNGDMLFNPGNMTKPIRMQNAFISTDEVEALCEFIGQQRGYSSPYTLPSVAQKRDGAGGASGADRDVLFEEAARIFIALQQASVSTLQRRLKVGYARAARIVDELEMAGIVGPPDGSKGRQVLLMSESELEAYI
jgi:S-DNA-T family DNA segregation ATPase FtsK/SpoIIIE